MENQLVKLMKEGDVKQVKDFYQANPNINNLKQLCYDEFVTACERGKLDTIKCILAIKPDFNIRIESGLGFHIACGQGHMDIVKFLYELDNTFDCVKGFERACGSKRLELVQWLYTLLGFERAQLSTPELEIVTKGFVNACYARKIHIAKWLYQTRQELDVAHDNSHALKWASYHNDLELVKWLCEIKPEMLQVADFKPFRSACYANHLEVARWFLETKPDLNITKDFAYVYGVVCASGPYMEKPNIAKNLAFAEFLYGFKPESVSDLRLGLAVLKRACYEGQLPVVLWAWKKFPQITKLTRKQCKKTFGIACKGGNLQVAKWLYANVEGLDISAHKDFAFRMACEYNQIDVIKWLYSVKPDIDISACGEFALRLACYYGQYKTVKWLVTTKPDIDVHINSDYPFVIACAQEHLDVAKFLYKSYPNINVRANNFEAFRKACEEGNDDVVAWLLDICPEIAQSSAMAGGFNKACMKNYLHVTQLLVQYKPELNDLNKLTPAFTQACKSHKYDQISWLCKLQPGLSNTKARISNLCECMGNAKCVGCPDITSAGDSCIVCASKTVGMESGCAHKFCRDCTRPIFTCKARHFCPGCGEELVLLKFTDGSGPDF